MHNVRAILLWSIFIRYYAVIMIIRKTKLNSVASVREQLYRPSDRHLPAKLVATFADRGCHVVSVTDPPAFETGTATFSFKWLLSFSFEAKWTPFKTHYF
jgi:hypothetical protein